MHKNVGLYLHIPFCQRKCEYCDFYSVTQLNAMDNFVDAVIEEIKLRSPDHHTEEFSTIFWGGGTPSLLSPEQLSKIWQAIHRHFNINKHGEFTIEVNPGTLANSKLSDLRSLGFNRLSMGVQSFNPAELQFLGRLHSVDEVYESFRNARLAGFNNINIDLMTAFPGITPDSFLNSLQQSLELAPEHISCYTLIFEPGTGFHKRMLNGELNPLSEDEEVTYYTLAQQVLGGYGYNQYEVSNFAKENQYICQHNLIYWKHQPYLGLGPSAHSFYQNRRSANRGALQAYIKSLRKKQLPVDFQETLSTEDLMFEYLFLNLRLREGISLNDFKQKFAIDFLQKFDSTIRQLSENGFIESNDNYVRLTNKGWLLADTVATHL